MIPKVVDPAPAHSERAAGAMWPVWAAAAAVLALVVLARIPASTIPQAGAIRENPRDGLRYVWIPSGDFEQGCSQLDASCRPDEQPHHKVMLRNGFWMGQTEVTVAAYRRFAEAAHRAMPPDAGAGGRPDETLPVVNVDWQESAAYCGWAGGRLPTEAEWEYAARGEDPEADYGPLPEIAWYAGNSGEAAHEVGRKPPNPFGIYDLLGNVQEWTADWYEASYREPAVRVNPAGPPAGQARVLRGGSWRSGPEEVRASARGHRAPAARSPETGFRCVASM